MAKHASWMPGAGIPVAKPGLAGEQIAAWSLLAIALCAGAGLRFHLAFSDDGIYWPDEIYQSFEPAHRLVYGFGFQAWEFVEGARNWAMPGLIAGLIWIAKLTGPDQPEAYLGLVRTVLCLIGLGTAYGSFRLAHSSGASALGAACAGLVFALSAPGIYFGHRAMAEVVSALPAVFGLALLLGRNEAGNAAGHAQFRALALGASLLGVAVLLRLQNGIFCVAILAVLAARRQWHALGICSGVLGIWALVYGVLDLATWGRLFHSARVYLQFNLIEGKASNFGVSPPDFYLTALGLTVGPVAAWTLAALALAGAFRAPAMAMIGGMFLALHTAIPHKELRFIFPALPVLAALAGLGVDTLSSAGKATRYIAAAALVAACVVSAMQLQTLSMMDLWPDQPQAGSALDRSGPVNRLLIVAGKRPDLCGIKLNAAQAVWSGGYTYLHKDVPLYDFVNGNSPEFFNYVVTRRRLKMPGVVARDGNLVLQKVREGCVADPDFVARIS